MQILGRIFILILPRKHYKIIIVVVDNSKSAR